MPRTNLRFSGFRVAYPDQAPEPVACFLADNYATAAYIGDPVKAVSDGSVSHHAAGEGVYGVIVGIIGFVNSNGVYVKNGKYIPANTRWTAHADRSQVLVVPAAPRTLFDIQADDATTVAALSTARSLRGNNFDIVAGTADTGLGNSGYLCDISTAAVTATLSWRIEDVVESPYNDPVSNTRFTLRCYANILSNFGGLPVLLGV